jgi:alkylation response protein AidB-like acyl-CoA dehydrogenase
MKNDMSWPGIDVLRATLAHLDPLANAATWLDQLVGAGLDRLPFPGSGRTLERWQAFAAVAERDLSLAKLYESHTDALAILAELGGGAAMQAATGEVTTWGVWAAEAPQGKALIERNGQGDSVIVDGAKCWCSGAASATHALLTAWEAGATSPQLIAVSIRQRGVEVNGDGWQAVGMADSASLDVKFDHAQARSVGAVGEYLSRPGFWHGGGGVAACWYGGTLAVAGALRRSLVDSSWSSASSSSASSPAPSPFRLAALGKVDLHLQRSAAVLRDAARWIDAHPREDASTVVLRARLAAEDCAAHVLDEVGRTLGAAPFCRDARFARMAADLPVFIRQSHAERDFASLADKLLRTADDAWML